MFDLNPGAFKALFIYSFLKKNKVLERNSLVICTNTKERMVEQQVII